MEQMKALLEKARNDKELMAKLDALGASGAEADKIIALAVEYGFSITAEDYRQAAKTTCPQKKGELKEEDLEAAAGGGTQNRYDPQRCGNTKRVSYECVGFLEMCWCDHYRKVDLLPGHLVACINHICVMGCYDYIGDNHGEAIL